MRTEKKAGGRPRKKDKPTGRLTVLADPSLKAKLETLSAMERRPIYEIIRDALEAYVAELPADARKALETLAARVDKRYAGSPARAP